MTISEIEDRFKATIDQHFSFSFFGPGNDVTLWFIGGVLQSALHILPTDSYYKLKRYCYDKHGYDPGGVTDGQMTLSELIGGNDE